jgi:hypothetical protein
MERKAGGVVNGRGGSRVLVRARESKGAHMGGCGSGGNRTSATVREQRMNLTEAIIAIADADDDQDYRVAWCRFWMTLRRMGFKRSTQKQEA